MSKDITRGTIRQKKTHQRCTKRSDTAEKVCAKHRKQGDCAPFWKARRLYTLLENRGTVHPSGKQGDCARFWKARRLYTLLENRDCAPFWKAGGLCTLLEKKRDCARFWKTGTVRPFGKQRFRAKKSSPTPSSLIYRHRPRAPVQPPPSRAGIPPPPPPPPSNMSVESC